MNKEIYRNLQTESRVLETRDAFANGVEMVRIWHRRTERPASMVVKLDYKKDSSQRIAISNELGGMLDLIAYLDISGEQMLRIFNIQPDPNLNEPFVEALMWFKEGGKQALADLLGEPIQYGWYDGFFENGPIGDPVNPQKGEKINPAYRIWRTEAEKKLLEEQRIDL